MHKRPAPNRSRVTRPARRYFLEDDDLMDTTQEPINGGGNEEHEGQR